MFPIFASSFFLGLILNAAPGPVFAATLRFGARGGSRSALAVQFGSLAGDAAWAILGLVGVGVLFRLEWLRTPLGIAGALGFLLLAISSIRNLFTDALHGIGQLHP